MDADAAAAVDAEAVDAAADSVVDAAADLVDAAADLVDAAAADAAAEAVVLPGVGAYPGAKREIAFGDLTNADCAGRKKAIRSNRRNFQIWPGAEIRSACESFYFGNTPSKRRSRYKPKQPLANYPRRARSLHPEDANQGRHHALLPHNWRTMGWPRRRCRPVDLRYPIFLCSRHSCSR